MGGCTLDDTKDILEQIKFEEVTTAQFPVIQREVSRTYRSRDWVTGSVRIRTELASCSDVHKTQSHSNYDPRASVEVKLFFFKKKHFTVCIYSYVCMFS